MTPEQFAAQQAYLDQLAAAQSKPSNAGYLVGGGLGVLGSTAAAIAAQRALNARRRGGVLDIRPEALKQSLGDIALRAKSARVSNYGQRMGNIIGQQNRLAGNAAMAATSPSQLQNMILQGQRQGAQQEAGLAQEGASMQQQNLGIQRGLRGQEAGYQDQARREYAQDVENLRNAVWSNINKGVNTAGQTAMMMMQSGGKSGGAGAEKVNGDMTGVESPVTFASNSELQSPYNPLPPVDDNVPRNLPLVPASAQLTGLEAEPSMMAAPQYGKTLREYLIQNPLKNTSYNRNMLYSPEAAARKQNMRSQMLRTNPYYSF